MSTVPYELYLEESACVHEVKAVQGFVLNGIVFTCRPIGKRSYALPLKTVETSKRVELGSPSYRKSSSMVAVCPEADSEASTSSSDSPKEPVPVTAEPSQGLASGPSYSEVARDAVANSGCAEWSVANRWKRAKAPAPRKPAEVAAAPSPC